MVAHRLTPSAASSLPRAAVLRRAWDCAWWLVRAHMGDRHLLPRKAALEPPPASWLEGWPSDRA